jgi:signal peptidase II
MKVYETLRQRWGYFLLAAGVLAADQASKIAADRLLARDGPVTVIPSFLNLWYSRNRGGLFGYFSDWEDPWRGVLLTLFPLVAVCLIAIFLARAEENQRSTLMGLALILGGATGNLVDRIARGEVVDFIDAYAAWPPLARWLTERFGTVHWPTFNVADSAIVVGAMLLVLDIVRPESGASGSSVTLEPPAPVAKTAE